MNHNAVETIMGAVVLVVAAVFLYFAYTSTHVEATSGYEVSANFDRVDGLREGTDVRISGIKVGSVVMQNLDPKTFIATVRMSIAPDIKLPKDTVAQIASSGLLGDNYMKLEPGNDDEVIPPGGQIAHTQSPMNLTDMIGQYIFGQAGKKDGSGGSSPSPDQAPK